MALPYSGDFMENETLTVPGGKTVKIWSRKRAYDGFCKVDLVDYEYARHDGVPARQTRELHHNGNVIAVLPVDTSRRTVLFVRQLRLPCLLEHDDPYPIEVCAGMIDAGEQAIEAAAREMEEELGFRPTNLTQIASCYSSPGVLAEKVNYFIADYDGRQGVGTNGGLAEEGEDIEILEVPCADLKDMLRSGELRDAKTVILVQHLMLEQPELFVP
jgi:nudix-type nucleoside diphosphatase (YffH/AdpP family)